MDPLGLLYKNLSPRNPKKIDPEFPRSIKKEKEDADSTNNGKFSYDNA